MRFEIDGIKSDAVSAVVAMKDSGAEAPPWRRAIPLVAVVATVALLTGLAVWNLRPVPPSAEVMRLNFSLPEGTQFTRPGRPLLAVSPDGRQLVFVLNKQLYLRSMSESEARPIPGTNEDINSPFFSPDGRSVGFYSFANFSFKKVALTGGAAITICPASNPYGVRWEAGDQIVFGQLGKGILRVSATGGTPEVIAAVKTNETAFGPQVLPGGRVLLFTLATGSGADRWDTAQIVAQRLTTGERKILGQGSDARFVPTGHLVYALGNSVFAVPFDAEKLTATGGPVAVIDGVRRAIVNTTGAADFSFSSNGLMAYLTGDLVSAPRTLALVDLEGAVKPLPLPPRYYGHPRLSPDGKQLAVQTSDGDEEVIWIYDLATSSPPRRLTFGGNNESPIWTPDGKRITFVSDRDGVRNLFWQPADGSGSAERLTQISGGSGDFPESPSAWSPLGKLLIFLDRLQDGSFQNLYAMSLEGDRKPKRLLTEDRRTQSWNLTFSPDAHWIAYAYGVLRTRYEIFVEPFPATGARYQISTNGGDDPVWSPDGQRLYYYESLSSKLIAVNVKTSAVFSFFSPVPLSFPQIEQMPDEKRNFDISPDGKRFVIVLRSETQPGRLLAGQVNIVSNWFEELKQRVPVH